MSAKPWFKFFPSDWRSDSALRMCTATARCLWLEMLCIMSEADPVGYLLVKGNRLDAPMLAVQSGLSLKEVIAGIADLEVHGVFDRRPDSTIFSRKMVRDARKSDEQRKRVSSRWSSENAEELDLGTASGITGSIPYGEEPEARSQKPDIPPVPSAPATDWPDGGMDVWIAKLGAASRGMADATKNGRLVIGAATVAQWKLNGFSWDHDVYPIVKALCATRRTPVGGWEYFNKAVRENYAKRIGLSAPVTAADIKSHGDRHDRKLAEREANDAASRVGSRRVAEFIANRGGGGFEGD